MNVKELEAQCMALSNVVDTEVVEGDPLELPTFAESTLYVWLVPSNSGGNDPELRSQGGPPNMIVRGRFGRREQVARDVPELARKLGVAQA